MIEAELITIPLKALNCLNRSSNSPALAAGCGETPYLKLLHSAFSATDGRSKCTGCSFIYGGSLPTTPWTTNSEGCGPAWANSLFEDNAEFGLGIKLALAKKKEYAQMLLLRLKDSVGDELVDRSWNLYDHQKDFWWNQRGYVGELKNIPRRWDLPKRKYFVLLPIRFSKNPCGSSAETAGRMISDSADWITFISTGKKWTSSVLDTVSVFQYGRTDIESISARSKCKIFYHRKVNGEERSCMAGDPLTEIHMLRRSAFRRQWSAPRSEFLQEAEAFDGPSLIIAYSHCIAHGYDMADGVSHQISAVKSGYWPLFHYNPSKPKGRD